MSEIAYIQNTSNISSSTSLENNEKFITVKYLNEYNKRLCKDILEIIDTAIVNISSQNCAFIDQNDSGLNFHFQGLESNTNIFNVVRPNDTIITFYDNTTLTGDNLKITAEGVQASIIEADSLTGTTITSTNLYTTTLNADTMTTTTLDAGTMTATTLNVNTIGPNTGSSLTLNNCIFGTNSPLPTLTGYRTEDNTCYKLAWVPGNGNAQSDDYIIRGGVLTADDNSGASVLYWSDNSNPDSSTAIVLAGGGGGSTVGFPGDIEININSGYLDRSSGVFIDTIGGAYKLDFDGCRFLSTDAQQQILDGGSFSDGIPYVIPFTIIPLASAGELFGQLMLDESGYNIEAIIEELERYPFTHYTIDSYSSDDIINIPSGSIVIYTVKIGDCPCSIKFNRQNDEDYSKKRIFNMKMFEGTPREYQIGFTGNENLVELSNETRLYSIDQEVSD